MTPTPYTLPFDAITAADLPLVGGKGANLGELARAGLPVPPGFCVTTAAYRRFLEASGQTNRLYALLDDIRPDDIEHARQLAQQVRESLLRTPLPDDVAQAILSAWRALGSEHPYAVRSSATAEDLPDASFAGQQETYLNVQGEEALLETVHRAWVSLFTDRAILYRLQQGFDHRRVALAVVVQRMIPADKSGVLFTADPVSGHRYTMVINASFGLGEAIVSGLVTPDTYRLDKRTGRVVRREIAEKTLAILPQPEGGTREVALPPNKPASPCSTRPRSPPWPTWVVVWKPITGNPRTSSGLSPQVNFTCCNRAPSPPSTPLKDWSRPTAPCASISAWVTSRV